MRVALYQPDIAGNVGTILRLCACMGLPLDLIEPMGFPWGAKSLVRAGMDYREMADVVRHVDWASFQKSRPGRIVLATTRGSTPLPHSRFEPADTLLFGSESSGVPNDVHDAADLRVTIPMRPGLRSLNVAVSTAIISGEALRQTDNWPK